MHRLAGPAHAGVRTDRRTSVGIVSHERDGVAAGCPRNVLDRRTAGPPESDLPSREPLDREPTLVDESVVVLAQKQQVVELRLPAPRPVAQMVNVDEAGVLASGEAAGSIAGMECPA
jgi:hypothetical protein